MDPTLESLVERAVPLTAYAWAFRYPTEVNEPTREESEAALEVAREVYETVIAKLPAEVSS